MVEHPVLKPELVNYGAIVLVLVSVKRKIVAILLKILSMVQFPKRQLQLVVPKM